METKNDKDKEELDVYALTASFYCLCIIASIFFFIYISVLPPEWLIRLNDNLSSFF